MNNEKEIEAFLIDRIAEVIREQRPSIGDQSFEIAKSYLPFIMNYLRHFLREHGINDN